MNKKEVMKHEDNDGLFWYCYKFNQMYGPWNLLPTIPTMIEKIIDKDQLFYKAENKDELFYKARNKDECRDYNINTLSEFIFYLNQIKQMTGECLNRNIRVLSLPDPGSLDDKYIFIEKYYSDYIIYSLVKLDYLEAEAQCTAIKNRLSLSNVMNLSSIECLYEFDE